MKKLLITSCSACVFGSLLSASVLIFDFDPALANGNLISQDYGDNISSTTDGNFLYGASGGFTPNVAVSYFGDIGGNQLSHWTTDYDELLGVAYYEPDGSSMFGITLTAESGFVVNLSSFDLAYYISSGSLTQIAVLDSEGAVVFSQDNLLVGGGTALNLNPNVTDDVLTIRFDTTGAGSTSDNFGIDNIEFSQSVVPEPSSYALIFGSLALFAVISRRRSF